jgi:hypothetical protein
VGGLSIVLLGGEPHSFSISPTAALMVDITLRKEILSPDY